ncbi:hypothetical protein J7M28_10320 [bacterium]|nr:hypothetical protein [bacterium]
MNRNLISILLSVALMLALGQLNYAEEKGFGGTLHFRDGQSVHFDRLGTTSKVKDYELQGHLGKQNVKYALSELGQVIFSDKEAMRYVKNLNIKGFRYYNLGTVIVVNKKNERFTLVKCYIRGDSKLAYVYNDPVTKGLRESAVSFSEIGHIAIGEHSGTAKLNAGTGEYFPAIYIFDPFTGERLIWAEYGKPAPASTLRKNKQTEPVAGEAPGKSEPAVLGGKTNLKLVITTPDVAFELFSSSIDLRVSLKGPKRFNQRVEGMKAAKTHTFEFDGIPSGDYTVVARYGNRTTMDIIRVVGDELEFHMVFEN